MLRVLATVAAAFALPWMGRLVDRHGPRRMTLIVALLLGLACLGFGAVGGLATLTLGFGALRFLGQGSLMMNAANLVAHWFRRRRGFAMGLMALGFAASMALHPPLGHGALLEVMSAQGKANSFSLHRCNFTMENNASVYGGYPAQHAPQIARRVAEAWGWLEAHGMIATQPGNASADVFFVTRLGERAGTAAGLREFKKALELPKERLHPAIADRCFGHFVRGLFDTAVFEAYKALEVAIRDAAGLPPSMVGVALVRKAFALKDGPLTDPTAEGGEQQALGDLMAGAIGSYKNPHSHRRVDVAAEEAIEMIVLASHLLRIVDARRKAGS